ncbi:MAG TPA: ABC transporter [Ruminococcaceae bacterium]|nr:ABC transporter [Oscillospiraceae bacterium]
MLEIKDLSMSYERTKVLSRVNFHLCEGEWLSIIGENGSGKTTLLKGIAGLLPLAEGTIELSGGVTRNTIGYLPQQTAIQRDFPACVHEVVMSGCTGRKKVIGFHNAQDKARAESALKELGLDGMLHRPYCDLSGGQQQRVLLARALCATEKLLILDEPVTGLDPLVAAEMYECIRHLNKDKRVAVIMVSHDINGAVRNSDKILHIGSNGVEFFGSTEEYLLSDLGQRFVGQ